MMELATYRRTYKDGDRFAYFLASDLHLDDPSFDEALFRSEMAMANKEDARVYLNGDILGLILPGDIKRYARGSDPGNVDDKIGAAVTRAENLLAPYVDIIDMIGTGNHETAVLKHHSVDATKLLIGFLNRRRDPRLPPIKHGGYTGFIRLYFEDENKHSDSYIIFYNHGQGGSSEVSRGIIDLQRRQYIRADLIWLGHKHKVVSTELDSEIGLNTKNRIYERKKRGVITGTYLSNFTETDADRDGYLLSYQEERQRTPQGRGGAILRLVIRREDRGGIEARVET
jgi:hypothetical protein